jgi:excisionase family DNA binding protein
MGLMTLEELADYLRVKKRTIYRLLERGHISAKKVGHQWRFDKASIDTWLHENSKKGVINILVVDDDEEICSLFKDALEESDFMVTTVNSSSKGLELIKDRDYKLVFLDLKMPEMDGAELFKRIKEVKPNLPVTIVTGYPDSDLMMKALTYGPLGVMKKPFSGSDILAAVNNFLSLGKYEILRKGV